MASIGVLFLYNVCIFVWILHGCLTKMVFAVDPDISVMKRLWCPWSNTRLVLGLYQIILAGMD